MSQAFIGSSYIQTMVSEEVNEFVRGHRASAQPPVELVFRAQFNPELNKIWFGSVMEVITAITMLSIVLTGAALIREREHGTVEHMLVMPVTPFEIMASKVWAMAFVVLVGSALSLNLVVRGLLAVPIQGSLVLFFAGVCLHLFATGAMGIFLATVARSMPQFGLLLFMVMLPMQILSGAGGLIRAQTLSAGGLKQREGMTSIIDIVMQAAPTTHFVRRLAPTRQPGRDRRGLLRPLPGPLPQDPGNDGVNRAPLARHSGSRPNGHKNRKDFKVVDAARMDPFCAGVPHVRTRCVSTQSRRTRARTR